jgi:hypothetical protein
MNNYGCVPLHGKGMLRKIHPIKSPMTQFLYRFLIFQPLSKDISKLEELFFNKYNRQIRGEVLGQFHSDFKLLLEHGALGTSVK